MKTKKIVAIGNIIPISFLNIVLNMNSILARDYSYSVIKATKKDIKENKDKILKESEYFSVVNQ